MKDFNCEELTIKIEDKDNEIIMNWLDSSCNNEIIPQLIQYINTFLAEFIEENKEKELKIDFRNLKLMSSSTIPIIMDLIIRLEKCRMKTQFIYNSNWDWQRASFKILKKITTNFKSVSVIGN